MRVAKSGIRGKSPSETDLRGSPIPVTVEGDHGALDLLLQRPAFDISHGDVGLVARFIDLVDAADVGMDQGSGGLGFLDEPD